MRAWLQDSIPTMVVIVVCQLAWQRGWTVGGGGLTTFSPCLGDARVGVVLACLRNQALFRRLIGRCSGRMGMCIVCGHAMTDQSLATLPPATSH